MLPLHVAPIVEGKGEELSIRSLLQRLGEFLQPEKYIEVHRPIRVRRDRFISNIEEREKAIKLGRLHLSQAMEGNEKLLLIMLDVDDDCPAELNEHLREAVDEIDDQLNILISFPVKEFESWFIASAESLRGSRGFPNDLVRPDDPEGIRGAKEWLTKQLPSTQTYKPTVDQPALTQLFDIEEAAKHSPSFNRFLIRFKDFLKDSDD